MRKLIIPPLIIVAATLGGCATAPPSYAPAKIVGAPAAGSKFSKIELGMSLNNVNGLIGPSKDCHQSYERDNEGIIGSYACPYKGEGNVIYKVSNSGLVVNRIVVDTNFGDYAPIVK